ncbi:MAG: oligosaccharide flippase family protein [Leptolyngbyaceae cyanobacterium RU_5_1]|nr:oligosaccharide flippase family protein [Leptolyngbyaceae cyanobacterium RU_5_1]
MTEGSMDKTLDDTTHHQPPSLKRRVLHGSIWTLGGHAVGQVIRLGSNLILTRLLFPEAFGLMALVYTVISGLEMLSDTGVGQSIIQSKQGDDPKFLNTAWTVQAIRGVILWLVACLLAWPAATFYNEPMLLQLLPVVGLNTLMMGLLSTKWAFANRHLSLKRLTAIELGTQVLGIVVMITCAGSAKLLNLPRDTAIWSLAIGALTSGLTKLILSHTYLPGQNNRFYWDQDALKEIQQFGRWIFVSTIMGFLVIQGNNLVIPKLLSIGFLGVYSVALNLSRITNEVVSMMGSRVLFPSYSELARDRPERLYPVLRRSRLVLNLFNLAVSLVFIFFGGAIVNFLYDDRYADAGWQLQLLSLGALVTLIGSSYTMVLLAQGRTLLMSIFIAILAGTQFAGMFAGYYFAGEHGVVMGIAASGWLAYPIQALCLAPISLWQPEVDLPLIVLASGIGAYVLLQSM